MRLLEELVRAERHGDRRATMAGCGAPSSGLRMLLQLPLPSCCCCCWVSLSRLVNGGEEADPTSCAMDKLDVVENAPESPVDDGRPPLTVPELEHVRGTGDPSSSNSPSTSMLTDWCCCCCCCCGCWVDVIHCFSSLSRPKARRHRSP